MIRHFRKNLFVLVSTSFIALSMLSTNALSEGRYQPENHIDIGFGFAADSGIFEGQSDQYEPLPILDIYFNQFRVSQNVVGLQTGWEMLSQKDFALFFAAQYDNTHLDVDSISVGSEAKFYGISDRDREWEIGIIAEYHSKVGLLEAHYFKGLNNDLETVGFLKMSRDISETGFLSITPGIFISYKSDEFNRYYYSVNQQENIDGAAIAGRPQSYYDDDFRPVYSPGNSGHFGADVKITYRFAKNLSFWSYIAVEDITGEVEMSPLVEEKSLYHLKAGIVYNFID